MRSCRARNADLEDFTARPSFVPHAPISTSSIWRRSTMIATRAARATAKPNSMRCAADKLFPVRIVFLSQMPHIHGHCLSSSDQSEHQSKKLLGSSLIIGFLDVCQLIYANSLYVSEISTCTYRNLRMQFGSISASTRY